EARQDRSDRCAASARAVDGGAAAGVLDPAGSHSRSTRPGQVAADAGQSALRVAAADPGGALSPWVPTATRADVRGGTRVARRPAATGSRPAAGRGRGPHY